MPLLIKRPENVLGHSLPEPRITLAGALLLTGFIDLAIAWRLHVAASGYRAVREDEQYVWISGAHSGFLAVLPQWSGLKLGEMHSRN